MADGQITYQVRIDSSRVSSDLSAAEKQINSGTVRLISRGKAASEQIGNGLLTFFGSEASGAESMLSRLAKAFSSLGGTADTVSTSLLPLGQQLKSITEIDTARLETVLGRLVSYNSRTQSVPFSANYPSIMTNTMMAYRSGSEYIPRDQTALLHKGEAVLTAAENQTLRAMGGVEGAAALAASAKQTAVIEKQVAAPAAELPAQNLNVTVELDGYRLAKAVAASTNEMNRQLNTRLLK